LEGQLRPALARAICLEAGADDASEIADVARRLRLGRLVDLAAGEHAAELGREATRLAARAAEEERALDHDDEGRERHHAHHQDDALGEVAHVLPEIAQSELHAARSSTWVAGTG